MNSKAEIGCSRTREIVDDLFVHPPVNDAELDQRLGGIDSTEARRLLIDRLEKGKLVDRSGPLFLAVVGRLGIGRQKRRLTRIALNLECNSRDRLWASMALTSEDPKMMDLLVRELGPEGMGILAELSLFELLAMQDTQDIGASIETALENMLDDRPPGELLARIDSCRQGIGVSCTSAFGQTLRNEELSHIRSEILDLFIAEATDEGIAFLIELRDESPNEDDRRDFQAALLRLRSRRIDPSLRDVEPSGYALVSNCDGQGDFVVLGVFENNDSTLTLVDLCLRAGGDVRDGAIYPRRRNRDVEDLVNDIQQQLGCVFVEVTLIEAAKLVEMAVKSAPDQEPTVPEDARPATTLFERIRGEFRWGAGSCALQAQQATISEIRSLLARPEYDDTWFFDLGDIQSGGMDLPSLTGPPDEWMEEVLSRLDSTSVRGRLVAMAEHMARWHCWNDEPEMAALCRAVAGSVRQGVAKSFLARVMLERSVETLRNAATEVTYQFGDPSVRQYYKMRFFCDLDRPTGRDLARLDMTEASASALGTAFDLLPGERRPRDEERDSAAYAIGKLFADHVVADGVPAPEETVHKMSRALAGTCRLTETERHKVLMTLMPTLFAFVEEVCSVCPVDCLRRPDQDFSEVFFTTEHPMSPDRH
ncbi:MAG: hypothetical protein GY854_31870 [Deltaproteobacteria bacterium]|nr:hypothetical protein [Deltaproteobacteria bacterium]